MTVQECFVLLCWTAVVLRQLQPQSAKKAVLKLVECQVHCLKSLTFNNGLPDTAIFYDMSFSSCTPPCFCRLCIWIGFNPDLPASRTCSRSQIAFWQLSQNCFHSMLQWPGAKVQGEKPSINHTTSSTATQDFSCMPGTSLWTPTVQILQG